MSAARAVLWATLLVLAVLACAGGRPDWVEGQSEAYPRQRYWIGVGEGDDLETAGNRARAEIARIFHVRIRDSVRDRQSTRIGAGGERTQQEIEILTKSDADATLEGVEVAESWTDPATGRRHALAVLDLAAAHARYRERAAEREAVAGERARQARLAADPLDATRAWLGAVAAARERDLWARRAALVRGGAASPAAPGSATAELEAGLAAALDSLSFGVEALESGPAGPRRLVALENEIGELLTSYGFSTAPEAESGPLRVRCRVRLEPVERGDPAWSHIGWDGSCELSRDGEVWIAATGFGAESHPSETTARTKARGVARRGLVRALGKELSATFSPRD